MDFDPDTKTFVGAALITFGAVLLFAAIAIGPMLWETFGM